MITFIIVIIVLIILVGILGFATFNVLKKNEFLEDVYNSQLEWINSLKYDISQINKKIAVIDEKGLFEGDDEIGWFFDEVKVISDKLSVYEEKIPTDDREKEEKEKEQKLFYKGN